MYKCRIYLLTEAKHSKHKTSNLPAVSFEVSKVFINIIPISFFDFFEVRYQAALHLFMLPTI